MAMAMAMAMAAVTAESINTELKTFDLDCGEGSAVLDRLLEQCIHHRLQADTIVLEWVAFSTTKSGLTLSLENLDVFEHEVLNKRTSKSRPSLAKKDLRLDKPRDLHSLQEMIQAEEEDESLMDYYSTPAKGSQKRPLSTPENPRSKRSLPALPSPRALLSPASFSPSVASSQKYGARAGRGDVVASLGAVEGASWSGRGGPRVAVRPLVGAEGSLSHPYKFMFQKLRDIRDVLLDKIEELGEELRAHFNIEEFSSVCLPAQDTVTVLGQVGCDSNGKLNAQSVVLEGDQEHSSGGRVPLELSELREYSLFPGQVVVLEGINTTGTRLVVSKMYQGLPLPFHSPEEPAEEDLPKESGPRMVLVACGPYTPSDSLNYEPLLDLIDTIKRDRPDVCVLLGPFLDSKHEQVEKCQLTGTFEEAFRSCLRSIVEGTRSQEGRRLRGVTVLPLGRRHYMTGDRTPLGLSELTHCIGQVSYWLPSVHEPPCSSNQVTCEVDVNTHLVIVPSLRDVHHHFVYPQPPFSVPDLSKEDRERVTFVSDPCTLLIDGVTFGLTSTDILFHMGAEEISSASGSDRLIRILRHILTQRSYYPLYPPAVDVNLDYEHFQCHGQMPVTPDVLIVPSDLRYFVKDVIGCVCVNPGRLTKGQVGGTYGRLLVQRGPPLAGGGRRSPCLSGQVVKI
ncbi:DPOA2 polymerase, partial [Atractosteus spatula]|nr:DPOA2 polymerase [Atractosteus spatula]